MDFKTATDRLTDTWSLEELADELGVSKNMVLRARMDPGNPNARTAPGGWEKIVASLARKRANELARLSEQLERKASKDG